MSREPAATPGFDGLMGIIGGTVAVSVVITLVTGKVGHWIPAIGACVVGLMAAQEINK